jgi:uncharacterized membrane protein required for colicin V production
VDVYVLLDILLLILVALFIPIGFWRGAYREAFVTLGVLFGASLGLFWGETWGSELATLTRLHESGGAFMVAMLCLIGSTFLIGYSAGAAVPVPSPGWIARSLGALVAGANGALLLSFALRDIRIYLLSGQETDFLDNAVIAPFLSQGTGWILLISAAVFVPVVLVVAMFGPETEVDEYFETGEYDTFDEEIETYSAQPVSRQASARVPSRSAVTPAEETLPIPAVPDEQSGGQSDQTDRGSRPAPETTEERPMVFGFRPDSSSEPSKPATEQESEPAFNHQPDATPSHRPEPGEDSPGEHAETPSQRETAAAPAAPPEQSAETSATESDEQSSSTAPAPKKPIVPGTCPYCRADIGDAEGFCPNCGRVI